MRAQDKKDMLHRVLLGQMDMCGFLSKKHNGVDDNNIPDPLDSLNMPSRDCYPGNYLSVPMAYKRIQYAMHKLGFDHNRIYVEGFSDSVSMFMAKDLKWINSYNNSWAASFYEAYAEFEALKPEDRVNFNASLCDSQPPSWPRVGEPSVADLLHQPPARAGAEGGGGGRARHDHDDVEEDLNDDNGNAEQDELLMTGGSRRHINNLNALYVQKNKVPPIKLCLRYNPLMCISAGCTRSEWEQQMGSFPAFFIYSMSRAIYSSASNPLLKPEYFMPEAKCMTANLRWREHMNDGENPLAGFCVAGKL